MPRLNLSPSNIQQLNDWLYGGPTDPIGLIAWLEQNPNADPAVRYRAEGERDLYLLNELKIALAIGRVLLGPIGHN